MNKSKRKRGEKRKKETIEQTTNKKTNKQKKTITKQSFNQKQEKTLETQKEGGLVKKGKKGKQ